MSGAIIAEGIAIVIDLSSAGIGAVDNLVQIIKSQGPLAATSSSASLIASVTGPIPGVGAMTNTVSLTLTLVKGAAYADENGASLGDYVSAVGSVVSIVGSLLAISTPLGWTALGVSGVGAVLTGIGFGLNLSDMGSGSGTVISPTLGTTPDPLVKTIIYVDPLVLDLDGDGLEITPLSKGILFDANGDAVKTGTAWVGADDGLLVWDRNGNGAIDTGAELFGDETILTDGQKAAHGFAALSELDTGSLVKGITVGAGVGVFDTQDAQYNTLRIWRDLNQDGISQANELQTLAQSGVKSISLLGWGDSELGQYRRVLLEQPVYARLRLQQVTPQRSTLNG